RIARFVRVGKNEISASSMLERLGFPAARQWTPVAELSGGERRRLQLTLLLDEPTNDLDIDTLQRLEDLLDGWPGTLVVVSHDRYLIERACDSVMALFGDGRLTHVPGGIQEYLDRRARTVAAGKGATGTAAAAAPSKAGSKGSSTATKAEGPGSAAEQREARKEIRRVERRLEVLDKKVKELHAALADAATDAPRLLALDAELREVQAERERLEEQWMEAAELADG